MCDNIVGFFFEKLSGELVSHRESFLTYSHSECGAVNYMTSSIIEICIRLSIRPYHFNISGPILEKYKIIWTFFLPND